MAGQFAHWGGWALTVLALAFFSGWGLAVRLYFWRLARFERRAENAEEFSGRINKANLEAMDILEDAIEDAGCGESRPAMTRALKVLEAKPKEEPEECGSDRKIPRVSRKEELVLRLLVGRGELYGLQVVKASNGVISRGTVYTVLSQMVDKGLIEDREEERPSDSGMVRRVYKIGDMGVSTLSALESDEKTK